MNLNEVNAKLKSIDIKGKAYIPVNQRILAFWELYPNGRIITQKLNDDGKRCDFLASVYVGDQIVATGHSFEFHDAGMVNKTSYVENAETSAVGRALGNLGIGITESLASADEVQAAQAHQEQLNRPSQGNTRPQTSELDNAKQHLWTEEKRFCELNGIADVKAWHKENIETRQDYSLTAEALNLIADELKECCGAE